MPPVKTAIIAAILLTATGCAPVQRPAVSSLPADVTTPRSIVGERMSELLNSKTSTKCKIVHASLSLTIACPTGSIALAELIELSRSKPGAAQADVRFAASDVPWQANLPQLKELHDLLQSEPITSTRSISVRIYQDSRMILMRGRDNAGQNIIWVSTPLTGRPLSTAKGIKQTLTIHQRNPGI